jgi:hypothetical protein
MREADLPTDYEQADSDLGDYDTTKPACYGFSISHNYVPLSIRLIVARKLLISDASVKSSLTLRYHKAAVG